MVDDAQTGDSGLPQGSFGPTGFTNTSVWADPLSRVFVVVVTNRVHLGHDCNVCPLRREVAGAVAAKLLPAS